MAVIGKETKSSTILYRYMYLFHWEVFLREFKVPVSPKNCLWSNQSASLHSICFPVLSGEAKATLSFELIMQMERNHSRLLTLLE